MLRSDATVNRIIPAWIEVSVARTMKKSAAEKKVDKDGIRTHESYETSE